MAAKKSTIKKLMPPTKKMEIQAKKVWTTTKLSNAYEALVSALNILRQVQYGNWEILKQSYIKDQAKSAGNQIDQLSGAIYMAFQASLKSSKKEDDDDGGF